MLESAKARNRSFDVLKGIGCIGVVFMHCEFPGILGTIVQCLVRWIVPLFFAISGYFFRKETVDECLRKSRHILQITIYATIFYAVFAVIQHLLIGDLYVYAQHEFTTFNIASLVIFNSPVFVNGHLWFLFALIYVYLACAVLIKMDLLKYRKVICAILMCMHFVIAYGFFLIGKGLPSGAYRNFLFEGIPFFLMGNLFYQTEQREEQDNTKEFKIAFLLVGGGLALSLAERGILGRDFSVHLGSVAVLAGLLILARRNFFKRSLHCLSVLGNRYSLFVYIIHPAVFMTADGFFNRIGILENTFIQWFRPINTLIWSILLSFAIYRVVHRKENVM